MPAIADRASPADAYLTNGSGYVATVWTERHRWVVIASRKELAEGIAIAEKYAEHNSRVVKSQNGWVRCSARAARSFRHRSLEERIYRR